MCACACACMCVLRFELKLKKKKNELRFIYFLTENVIIKLCVRISQCQ